ncbi:MAG: IS5 family transposase, partial [Planctomycetes bacterium]|nr:IS5 family transposase [Planctomycetota bacterium]
MMEVIVPSLLAVESKRGRGQRLDLVDVVCGIVYVLHEGIRWRALPTVFGKWESVYSRLYRWTKDERTSEMFREVVLALKRGELRSLDASYVKVHQDANVANPEDEAMGPSRAGRTTKIHALVDDAGHAVKLELTGGNINDCTLAPVMMEPVAEGETLLADKAYDVDALREALKQSKAGPLAGVILISDGGQNSGVEPLAVADAASELQVPFYTVGVGSTQPRRNLRVQELTAPSRVYPDDRTTVHGLIHGEGFAGRTVDVELFAREAGAAGGNVDRIGRQQITFTADGEVVPVQFDIEPAEIGRLLLDLRIVAPTDDQYAPDNHREIEVEVVETQTRVLLIASGPTREYRFLRNQLRRDRHATVDIWLQSALPGISQDADRILDEFPLTKEVLYPYDCIVAFDPDWTELDAQQVDLLESWVAEESGGLIVVAGPIHTASWVQSPEHIKIRSLYPVEFQRRLTLLDDGLYGSNVPWPIDFSREGEESDFLWLGNTSEESRSLWSRFEGVFGCYAVKGPKPGARVLGRYSDPDAGLSAERPVYLAEQFYGSGRVLYIGSGELWRLRTVDLSYFEVLYTKLIRHVSQGRLLRGSSLGQLLVERDRYSVGEDVVVRAQLSSASREPLVADRVTARLIDPAGNGENLTLTADLDRPGNFVGQFDVRREGSYRIELSVPDAPDQPLVRRIQAMVPNLEFEKTRRNEALLSALATRTGGRYYTSLQTALEGNQDV